MQTLKERYELRNLRLLERQLYLKRVKKLHDDISILCEAGPSRETLNAAMSIIKQLEQIAKNTGVKSLDSAIKNIRSQITSSFKSSGSIAQFLKDISNAARTKVGLPKNPQDDPIRYALMFTRSLIDGFSKLNDVIELHGVHEAEALANIVTSKTNEPDVGGSKYAKDTIGSTITANPKYRANIHNIIANLFDLKNFRSIINDEKAFIDDILNIPLDKVAQISQNLSTLQDKIDTVTATDTKQTVKTSTDDKTVQDNTKEFAKEIAQRLIDNDMGLKFPDTLENDLVQFITSKIIRQ